MSNIYNKKWKNSLSVPTLLPLIVGLEHQYYGGKSHEGTHYVQYQDTVMIPLVAFVLELMWICCLMTLLPRNP